MPEKTEKSYANNRKAFHDYHILETVEAGMVLTGTEVKSIREGKISLQESYARIRDGEVWLYNSHVATYDQGNRNNHETDRVRKLLLHKGQIAKLAASVRDAGKTLIPLKVYPHKGKIKVVIGLARGKKQYDKREAIAERDASREIQRALKEADRQ